MGKANMNDLLKKRMSATQQASELQTSDEAYQHLFQQKKPTGPLAVSELPLRQLKPFFTADIGFRPYPKAQLEAFAEQLREEGLLVRIIVRPIPDCDLYEILSGHNRVGAAKLAGWENISAEIVEADDDRAIVIATSTNLIQRQSLSIVERGKAYKALLDAKNRCGQRNAAKEESTFGDNRQRYNARKLVAEFFGVTEYEIRKVVKLTQLIPELLEMLETGPKRLNLACADLIADYDQDSQQAFIELCGMEGYPLNKAVMQYIIRKCPPPAAFRQAVHEAWRDARADGGKRCLKSPRKITFDRKLFAPYLEGVGSDQELENLFLEFLRERVKNNPA